MPSEAKCHSSKRWWQLASYSNSSYVSKNSTWLCYTLHFLPSLYDKVATALSGYCLFGVNFPWRIRQHWQLWQWRVQISSSWWWTYQHNREVTLRRTASHLERSRAIGKHHQQRRPVCLVIIKQSWAGAKQSHADRTNKVSHTKFPLICNKSNLTSIQILAFIHQQNRTRNA